MWVKEKGGILGKDAQEVIDNLDGQGMLIPAVMEYCTANWSRKKMLEQILGQKDYGLNFDEAVRQLKEDIEGEQDEDCSYDLGVGLPLIVWVEE